MNWHYEKNGEETVLKLAKEIAAELDGFTVRQDTDMDNLKGLIHLIKGDLDIYITEGRWNTPAGKLSFHGGQPDDPNRDVWKFDHHTINVSVSRGPEAIARDITRRLLPGYAKEVTRALGLINEGTRRRAERDSFAHELAERLPSGTYSSGGSASRTHIRFDDGRELDDHDGVRGDLEVSMNGPTTVTIDSSNRDFLLELADLISKYSA